MLLGFAAPPTVPYIYRITSAALWHSRSRAGPFCFCDLSSAAFILCEWCFRLVCNLEDGSLSLSRCVCLCEWCLCLCCVIEKLPLLSATRTRSEKDRLLDGFVLEAHSNVFCLGGFSFLSRLAKPLFASLDSSLCSTLHSFFPQFPSPSASSNCDWVNKKYIFSP